MPIQDSVDGNLICDGCGVITSKAITMLESLKRGHYFAKPCSIMSHANGCDCGAAEHNNKVNSIIQYLRQGEQVNLND